VKGEVESGQELVVEELRSACGRGRLYEWGPSDFDLPQGPGIHRAGPTLYPLAVTVGGRREVLKFTEEELRDLPMKGHLGEVAQQAVTEKLNELLGRFEVRKPRIGF
jgi:hypothetical protein